MAVKHFHPKDAVIVNKDITRIEGPYASAGDSGRIVEEFRPGSGSRAVSVKVRMDADGKIKTFRATSVTKVPVGASEV